MANLIRQLEERCYDLDAQKLESDRTLKRESSNFKKLLKEKDAEV